MNRSSGVCMTDGHGLDDDLAAEALGLALPGSAGIPAVDAGHPRLATETRPAHRRDGVGRFEAGRTCSRRAASTTP